MYFICVNRFLVKKLMKIIKVNDWNKLLEEKKVFSTQTHFVKELSFETGVFIIFYQKKYMKIVNLIQK